MNIELVVCDA